MMTSDEVVKTLVTTTKNSPFQDYTQLDDQTTLSQTTNQLDSDYYFLLTIFQQFGKEILADEKGELRHDKILKILEAANGAEYGKRRYVGTLRTALTDVARIRVLKRQLVH